MASSIDAAAPPALLPPAITICGDGGTGKTSLAALTPAPIFLQAERGLTAAMSSTAATLPVDTADQIYTYLVDLLREPHSYKTLVIDSITSLDRIFKDHVIKTCPKNHNSLASVHGGYQAGYDILASMHQRVRRGCEMIRLQRGMNIIFIGHLTLESVDLPDTEKYSRYTLNMHKLGASPYINDVDLVGMLRLQTFVIGKDKEKKKAKSDGTRELIVTSQAGGITKNRLGITETLYVEDGKNPLADYIPSFKLTQENA